MKMRSFKNCLLVSILCYGLDGAFAQDVVITVNADQGKKAVSPYIYGSNTSFDKPAAFYKDAGLRFARMNAGNNATKYNWRKKLTSHPDWYNNVYSNDWDANSLRIESEHPDIKVMWAFQLLGRVASSTNYNFNDWAFNQSKYWAGVNQNLAGGGVPNTANPGGKALVEGNPDLYTVAWPADSTVEILNHWFGVNGIGLNKEQFLYWNMDNEPDIWNGTHDDVMPALISASQFMDRFIEVAKKARALFPEIKICGPVTTSEWQWFKWGSENLVIDGKYYCWLEYFIKRLADEEKASGIRLLDVFDLHNYPYAASDNEALQLHRLYYDKSYDYPGANGIKTINGGWDNSLTKEYIFQRISDWLTQYFGENHGIKLGISEWGPASSNPNVCSVVYGSLLGTFANNGVEYLTPWVWETGMWETLHLYSRYSKSYSISSSSTLENVVSAYTTVNASTDSMTVIIINRDPSSSHSVRVNLTGFPASDGVFKTLQLSSLPADETFKSHTSNALKSNSVLLHSDSFIVDAPSLSTTAILLSSSTSGIQENKMPAGEVMIYPNPAADKLKIRLDSNEAEATGVKILDLGGRPFLASVFDYDGQSPISLNLSELAPGFYLLSVKNRHLSATKELVIVR
jgi:hypothetical protein